LICVTRRGVAFVALHSPRTQRAGAARDDAQTGKREWIIAGRRTQPPSRLSIPIVSVLRQNAIQADLIRWDDSRGRFVLTGTGRNRITARSRTSGKILRFKMRDDTEGRAPLRKA